MLVIKTHLEPKLEDARRETDRAPNGDEKHDTIANEQPCFEANWNIGANSHESDGADHSRNR